VNKKFEVDILNASNFTSFGFCMSGRKSSTPSYRYAFNTQEKIEELGEGHTTALYWEYDGRSGRRWNLDPQDQVSMSNYACLGNNPIINTDVNGDIFVGNLIAVAKYRIGLEKRKYQIRRELAKPGVDRAALAFLRRENDQSIDEFKDMLWSTVVFSVSKHIEQVHVGNFGSYDIAVDQKHASLFGQVEVFYTKDGFSMASLAGALKMAHLFKSRQFYLTANGEGAEFSQTSGELLDVNDYASGAARSSIQSLAVQGVTIDQVITASDNANQWAANRYPLPTRQESVSPDDQHLPSQMQHNGQPGPNFTDSGTWEDHFSNEKSGGRHPRFQISPFTIFGRNITIGKFQLERVVEKGNKAMKQ